MSSIHIDCRVLGSTLNVVVLCLLEVPLHFQLLSQVLVSVFQQVFAELHYKANHVVIQLSFLVHIDGQVRLIGSQVHPLSILIVTFSFKFPSLLYIQHCVL